MSARVKATPKPPATREGMEALVGEITALKIEELRLKSEMDARLQAVRDGYERPFAELAEKLAARLPAAQAWAENNTCAFSGLKSLPMLHGVVGWRVNTPSLKTLAGWTWDRVLEKLNAAGFLQYIRVKQEPNKQALLSDRDTLGDELKKLGMRVVQDEEFFVEPLITPAETREVAR